MASNITITSGFQVPMFCVLSLELLFGVASCSSVLWVYCSKRQARTAANMFIANLAVVDSCLCILGIPFTIARLGLFPLHTELFCLCHEGITSSLRNASIVTLLLICYDRYQSITSPFRLRLTFKKAKKALTCLWISCSFTFFLPFIEYAVHDYTTGDFICINFFSDTKTIYYVRLYYFPAFFIATLISLPCYWKISKAALSRIQIHSILVKTSLVIPIGSTLEERTNTTRLRQKEWRVAKMTGAIMCSVCILWLPYMIFTFVLCFMKPDSTLVKLEFIFLMIGYFNCAINPLLYAFTKQKFRIAFMKTLPRFSR